MNKVPQKDSAVQASTKKPVIPPATTTAELIRAAGRDAARMHRKLFEATLRCPTSAPIQLAEKIGVLARGSKPLEAVFQHIANQLVTGKKVARVGWRTDSGGAE